MTLPGHSVVIGERAAAPTSAGSTANGFMVGIAERGPTDKAVAVISLADAVDTFGERISGYPTLYDSLDVAFREGATLIYVGRAVGAGAKASSAELEDSEGKKVILLSATSEGEWGNKLKVEVELKEETVTITVKEEGTTVESSPALDSIAAIVSWAEIQSAYLTAETKEAGKLPKKQTVELKGGLDENAKVETTQIENALDLFSKDLGPGQVAAPSFTTEAIHKAILTHCDANNRRALLDDDTDDAETLVSDSTALRSATGSRYGSMWAPHAVIPGLTKSTHRTVPYSAVQMGLIARAEAEGYNPNQAAAGKRGRCRYVIGLSQTYTDAQREELNDGGVSVAITIRGVPTSYGNRTLTNPTTDEDWLSFSASRLVMGVAAKADEVLENYDFEQIDGHGYVFKRLAGDLAGSACLPYYLADALYGQTPEEAFSVNTGPDVNTPTTIANEEIRAQIAIRVSRTGEMLVTEVVKVPTTESLL